MGWGGVGGGGMGWVVGGLGHLEKAEEGHVVLQLLPLESQTAVS